MKSGPHQRYRDFIKWAGSNCQTEASILGCSRALISMIVNQHRAPGRSLANLIERRTAAWSGGPIRSEEWDADQHCGRALTSTRTQTEVFNAK